MTTTGPRPLLLVGDPDAVHVGRHLRDAAREMGQPVTFMDTREAFAGPAWRRRLSWWARGHRPVALRAFSARVVQAANDAQAATLVATGLAPVDRQAIDALGAMGVTRANFLTDDPWNPAHRAPWFLQALGGYDLVFTPRRRNIPDLEALDGPRVVGLSFAYNPQAHFPGHLDDADRQRFDADVMFAGGADADRVEVASALIASGLSVALYGGYWERHAATRRHARGFLDEAGLRQAVAGARITLCLVRRANRDDQSMRSFEAAAMRGCLLMERTPDHEALFGADGDAVRYFTSADEAVTQARDLLADPEERVRLAARAHALVTGGHHTYRDRLDTMLRTARQDHEDRADRSRPLSRV